MVKTQPAAQNLYLPVFLMLVTDEPFIAANLMRFGMIVGYKYTCN
jgi:hypothetical protein